MLLSSEGCLEIHFGIVVAALEQLFHLFDGGLAGIGARAGVCDGAVSYTHLDVYKRQVLTV